jgi:hypothetical protein
MYPQRVLLQDYSPLLPFLCFLSRVFNRHRNVRERLPRGRNFFFLPMSLLRDLERSQMSVAVPGWRNQLDPARLLSSLPLCRLASPPQ